MHRAWKNGIKPNFGPDFDPNLLPPLPPSGPVTFSINKCVQMIIISQKLYINSDKISKQILALIKRENF